MLETPAVVNQRKGNVNEEKNGVEKLKNLMRKKIFFRKVCKFFKSA